MHDAIRLHPDDRAERPETACGLCGFGRTSRLRLRGLQRPLLTVAVGAGPCAQRLDAARGGGAGDRAGRAVHLRDVPDDPLPPGDRRAAGRHAADPRRRQVHPRASAAARTSTSTSSARAGRRSSGARTCCARPSRSSGSCSPARWSTGRATTSRSTPRGCGTCRRCPVAIAAAVSGERSVETFSPLVDHLIAVEPDKELVDGWHAARKGTGLPGDSRVVGQIPICWDTDEAAAVARAHEQFRWFAGGWSVNADLPTTAGFAGATQFVRRGGRGVVHPVRARPRRHRRGGERVLGGGLHRHRPGPGRRRGAGPLPRRGRRRRCWRNCAKPLVRGFAVWFLAILGSPFASSKPTRETSWS